jgi:hypothetical protein
VSKPIAESEGRLKISAIENTIWRSQHLRLESMMESELGR